MAKVDPWMPRGATRERIIRAAFGLDADKGYRGSRLTGNERYAPSTPVRIAAKEETLAAALDEVAAGIEAAIETFEMLAVDDIRTELTLLGRGLLGAFARWHEQIDAMVKEADQFPGLVAGARSRVLDPTQRWLAAWLTRQVESGRLAAHDTDAIAAVAIGSLLYHHIVTTRFGGPLGGIDEERFLKAWVDLFARRPA